MNRALFQVFRLGDSEGKAYPFVDIDIGKPHVSRAVGYVLPDLVAEELVLRVLEEQTDGPEDLAAGAGIQL